jgi:hypothetical protein
LGDDTAFGGLFVGEAERFGEGGFHGAKKGTGKRGAHQSQSSLI